MIGHALPMGINGMLLRAEMADMTLGRFCLAGLHKLLGALKRRGARACRGRSRYR